MLNINMWYVIIIIFSYFNLYIKIIYFPVYYTKLNIPLQEKIIELFYTYGI